MHEKYKPQTFHQKMGYLVEECGEVLQAVGKTQRWGLANKNPELKEDDPRFGETNRQWLLREMENLEDAVKLLREEIYPLSPIERM
jgi:NTP pyrophosphatase (non-canonical NTP hydrolase)